MTTNVEAILLSDPARTDQAINSIELKYTWSFFMPFASIACARLTSWSIMVRFFAGCLSRPAGFVNKDSRLERSNLHK
jgi:hypothetical protein